MPFEKIVKLMVAYDTAPIGSQERVDLGGELDKEGSKKIKTERDFWNVVSEYKKFLGSK